MTGRAARGYATALDVTYRYVSPLQGQLLAAMQKHSTSIVVELQQRAVEYSFLARMDPSLLKVYRLSP